MIVGAIARHVCPVTVMIVGMLISPSLVPEAVQDCDPPVAKVKRGSRQSRQAKPTSNYKCSFCKSAGIDAIRTYEHGQLCPNKPRADASTPAGIPQDGQRQRSLFDFPILNQNQSLTRLAQAQQVNSARNSA